MPAIRKICDNPEIVTIVVNILLQVNRQYVLGVVFFDSSTGFAIFWISETVSQDDNWKVAKTKAIYMAENI